MKVVLITGATSGIGMASAKKYAEMGYSLSLTGRDEKVLNDLKDDLAGTDVLTIPADLTDMTSPKMIIEKTIDQYKQLDVLINAAGIIASDSIENTKYEKWKNMFALNVDAIFLLMQHAIPHLKKSKVKAVVNVSSVVGIRQFPGVFSYSVSKAALDQLTKVSALELAPKQIRVNAINPGVVVTNLHRRSGMDDERYAAFLEHSKTTHPMGRVGQAEEAAELIYFLGSEKSGWITGQTVALDGGRSLTCFR